MGGARYDSRVRARITSPSDSAIIASAALSRPTAR